MNDQLSKRHIVRVSQVMAQSYAMIDGLATIQEAIDLFKQDLASVLLVNKRHDDDEYGLLLLSDIAKQVVAKDRAPERVNVYEVMSKPVIAVDPDMDVRYCARLFERFGLSIAPVIKLQQVVGVVSYNEIVFGGLLGEDSR
ncbi:CBS domain-containing protein [Neptunomonas phycophila]|jgi:predicted transcriptional regulator|uniref:CBS domain-containing protein n=1 Tax=Neptunomonas phycophila TaxID=1572645 RepID=A0AAW7XHV5_9GAMM|nr:MULTISPECIES: CBS domain-containing protein [Neptunomonas]MBT3146857.1 CBS domain-containing protein [Neptunomonas phycophila]MDN2661406.1 CBS domain-containing protein [Neptunomonas sp. CHC150]MDO6452649.1 CBS domain-containing protein [Neptunomonas phycophila]MDO6467696.1 CBS domain-containing protein [Neptunomonas phycophila]MDO6783684.1 CBS domain-containing protein [Neptunomonas phycophila]